MQASLLLLSWHPHPCCIGVAVAYEQASLQSRHLCRHCNNVVALVTMASLQLSSWCCHPHHNGIVAIIDLEVSLPLSRHHCPLALAPWPTLHGLCGIVVPIALNLALTSNGRHHRHCTGIAAPVKLVSLRRCACLIALVMLALLSLVRWH